MSAGLATDDPWGDRQQGLPLDRFAELLAAGPTFAWPPGTVFDYSNLGYGILGRVITNVAGAEYREVVRDRLLVPLGMTSSTYLEEEVPEARLAHGYVRRGEELVREGTGPVRRAGVDGRGVLLGARPRALGRRVPGRVPGPLRPRGPAPAPARVAARDAAGPARLRRRRFAPMPRTRSRSSLAGGYGFGLFIATDPDHGTVVSHSGGYPGFGSNMAWHPATGLGVIALGNLRYAQVERRIRRGAAGPGPGGSRPAARGAPGTRRGTVPRRRRGTARALGRRRRGRGVRDEPGPRRAAGPAAGRGGEGRRGPGPVPARRGSRDDVVVVRPPALVAARGARLGRARDPRDAGGGAPPPDAAGHPGRGPVADAGRRGGSVCSRRRPSPRPPGRPTSRGAMRWTSRPWSGRCGRGRRGSGPCAWASRRRATAARRRPGTWSRTAGARRSSWRWTRTPGAVTEAALQAARREPPDDAW